MFFSSYICNAVKKMLIVELDHEGRDESIAAFAA